MHGGVPAIAPNIFLRSIKSAPNDDETITLMTLEGLNTFLQLASAVILALTFLVGAGAIWTSYRLRKRQSARIAAIELEAAQQRERAAVAERDLLQLRQRLAPRSLTLSQRQALLVALQSAPSKGPVEVSSPTGNGEARDFARE